MSLHLIFRLVTRRRCSRVNDTCHSRLFIQTCSSMLGAIFSRVLLSLLCSLAFQLLLARCFGLRGLSFGSVCERRNDLSEALRHLHGHALELRARLARLLRVLGAASDLALTLQARDCHVRVSRGCEHGELRLFIAHDDSRQYAPLKRVDEDRPGTNKLLHCLHIVFLTEGSLVIFGVNISWLFVRAAD